MSSLKYRCSHLVYSALSLITVPEKPIYIYTMNNCNNYYIITQHIQDLMNFIFSDKEQLLEIAKANAAAMCAKAGMPIPASLRTSTLPFALPSMAMNAAVASMTAGTI